MLPVVVGTSVVGVGVAGASVVGAVVPSENSLSMALLNSAREIALLLSASTRSKMALLLGVPGAAVIEAGVGGGAGVVGAGVRAAVVGTTVAGAAVVGAAVDGAAVVEAG